MTERIAGQSNSSLYWCPFFLRNSLSFNNTIVVRSSSALIFRQGVLGVAQLDATSRVVRDVAPTKMMCCISFRVPASVLYADDAADQPEKKQRTR